MSTSISLSITAGIATLTLDRAEKRNAMHAEMIHALSNALVTLANDTAVRVVLLRGNGAHFCAGADIAWMQQAGSMENKNQEEAQLLADLMYQLHTFPKPTIALVQGACMGGGLGLVCASDIAIAADDAYFTFSEVKIGIAPSVISPYVLAALGERTTRYYFLTAERMLAEVALQKGLIQQITPADTLLSVGIALADMLLHNSPKAMTAVKELINEVAREKISKTLADKTAAHLAALRASAEAQEGLQAFLQKRKPNYVFSK